MYTAYYIVKHCLVAKGTKDEYIEKIIKESVKAIPVDNIWSKNAFIKEVNNLVTTYEDIKDETTNN